MMDVHKMEYYATIKNNFEECVIKMLTWPTYSILWMCLIMCLTKIIHRLLSQLLKLEIYKQEKSIERYTPIHVL